MKKSSLLALLFSSVLLLSACQKANAPTDEPEALPVNDQMQGDANPASEDRPTENLTFDFDTVVEESGATSADPQTQPVELPDSAGFAEPSSSEVKSFSMTAKQWEFVPNTITVNEGDRVRLSIASTDVSHGFALMQFGVNVKLEPGETQTVEFVADKKGTYTYFCNVFCGHSHGQMKGTLVVQ